MIRFLETSRASKAAVVVAGVVVLLAWRRRRPVTLSPVLVGASTNSGKGGWPGLPSLDGFAPFIPIDDRQQCFVAEPLTWRTIH